MSPFREKVAWSVSQWLVAAALLLTAGGRPKQPGPSR